MPVFIDEKREEIAEACQRYGIERLFIFGSALRDDFRHGDSDIDLLVEFGPVDISRKFHAYLGKLWATGVFAAAEPTNPPKSTFLS